MSVRRRYRKKANRHVVAVKLDLNTEGFNYKKWGGVQTCKAGDWILNNAGDVYSVDNDVFERTYQKVSDGIYAKVNTVWAEKVAAAGVIETKEGQTHYQAGDYVVFNDEQGQDGYAIKAEKFEEMYEPLD